MVREGWPMNRTKSSHSLLAIVLAATICADLVSGLEVEVDGELLAVRKAQLHVHTLCSFRGEPEDLSRYPVLLSDHLVVLDDILSAGRQIEEFGELDHACCTLPANTLLRAQQIGLDIVGFSDHAHEISGAEWEWHLYRQLTEQPLQFSGVWLRGFEWSPVGPDGGMWHINVFGSAVPSFVRKDLQWCCPHTAQGWCVGGQRGPRTEPGGDYPLEWHSVVPPLSERPDRPGNVWVQSHLSEALSGLAEWIETGSGSQQGAQGRAPSAIVCQLNHPQQWSSGYEVWLQHAEMQHRLRAQFALFEVGGGTAAHVNSIKTGEGMYRQALARGWHVGPTIGIDNQSGMLLGAAASYTGVWLAELTQPAVVDALLARRIFATELPGLEMYLQLARPRTAFMGDRGIACAPGSHLEFLLVTNTRADPSSCEATLVAVSDGGSVQEIAMAPLALGQWGATVVSRGDVTYYARLRSRVAAWRALSAPIGVTVASGRLPSLLPQPSDAPLRWSYDPVLVIDRSGSIQDAQGVMYQIQRDAETFVDELMARAQRVAVVNFSGPEQISVDCDFTSNRARILHAIRSPGIGEGWTALYQAVVAALDSCPDDARPVVILFSDGGENRSDDSLSLGEVIRRAQQRGVPVLTVGYIGTHGRYEHELRELATHTGAFYERAEDLSVATMLERFSSYLRSKREARPTGSAL